MAESAPGRIPNDLPALRLLVLSPGRIASTQIFDLVFQGLAEQGAIEYRALYDGEASPEEQRDAAREADVVFFLRSFREASLAVLRFAKEQGKLVVYSTDDDFRELDPDTPLGRAHLEPATLRAYEAMIAEADLVWLYTEEMRRRYGDLATRVAIGRLPSFVEINAPRSRLDSTQDRDAVLVVGYGGSSTHENDLRVVIRPLLEALETHPHVRAQFINFAPKELARHPRVEVRPFFGSLLSYYEFLRQARWSIGLAPLEDTRFNRGKTNNKYREYAGLGIPGIYSRMPVYADHVQHLDTGCLADHDEASFGAELRRLIEDPALRHSIRLRALQDAASTYSLRGAQLHFLREISRLAIDTGYAGWHRPRLVAVGYDSTSSMQIGVRQPLERLAREGLVDATIVEPDASPAVDLALSDAILVMRAFEDGTLPLLGRARAHSIPVIAAWDDDFLSIPTGGPLGEHYHHPAVVRSIEQYLSEASLIWATTPPLFARSSEYNDALFEAIYGFDETRLPVDAEGDRNGDEPWPISTEDPPRIGFFGSNDAMALPWMVTALRELRERHGRRIAIEAIGIDPPESLRPLLDWYEPGILAYDESLRLLRARGWAVGLAPLDDSLFNAAKQATKLRDYAWAGATIVCSRVPAYERALIDRVHGRLVENQPAAWIAALEELLDDPTNARALARGARDLLAAVHVQDLTNAAWLQLLWRIGATARSSKAGAAARLDARAPRRELEQRSVGHPGPLGPAEPESQRHRDGQRRHGRASRERTEESTIVELCGKEPALYVGLDRSRHYRIRASHQRLCAVEVCVGSAAGATRARLCVALSLPSGERIREGTLDLGSLRSATWAKLEFDELRNSRGRDLVLSLHAAPLRGESVGVFESSRFESQRLSRFVRQLGLAPLVAAPFLRLLYAGGPGIRGDEAQRAEGAGASAPDPTLTAPFEDAERGI